MKGRIIFGSILAVFVLLLVPITNAIQIQTVEKECSSSLPSWCMMKTMYPETIEVFLQTLVKNYPELSGEFKQLVKEIDKTLIASLTTERSERSSYHSSQGSLSANNNQTFLEKIYWKIFNYRLFRLYLSVCIYLYHPSKLTMMRTMTWGIKLLRLVKLGALLGFVTSNPQQPTQPAINFAQDLVNKTLTVISVTPNTVLWSDIDQIGSGHCDPLSNGPVMVGDIITNCTGFIVLRYVPSNEILGFFEFD